MLNATEQTKMSSALIIIISEFVDMYEDKIDYYNNYCRCWHVLYKTMKALAFPQFPRLFISKIPLLTQILLYQHCTPEN